MRLSLRQQFYLAILPLTVALGGFVALTIAASMPLAGSLRAFERELQQVIVMDSLIGALDRHEEALLDCVAGAGDAGAVEKREEELARIRLLWRKSATSEEAEELESLARMDETLATLLATSRRAVALQREGRTVEARAF
ncbi:MAG TPA: hypothetical protein VN181_15870, partial [Thermoanaerobaculia bacterium]|nr:hypothetical protein [Thermoanaerobaculia bacterium]